MSSPLSPRASRLNALGISACAVALAASGLSSAFASPVEAGGVRLVVDANRDGRVDLTGTSDDADRATATVSTGALILPNLDDDTKRCGPKELACNDASDEVVNGADDALDLAPLLTAPAAVAEGTTATLKVDATSSPFIRVFANKSGAWSVVTPSTLFSTAELKAGLKLGVEAKDIIRDAKKWDGTVTFTLAVTEKGKATTQDVVKMRVAPILTHTHTQVTTSIQSSAINDAFASAFDAASKQVGGPAVATQFEKEGGDVWSQDWFEPTYASIPREGGAQSIRVLVRADQERMPQMQIYSLRGPGVGVVQLLPRGEDPRGTRASMGNLETIPAYPGYPAGRIIMGEGQKDKPTINMIRTFADQGLQKPMILNTGWLAIGHVDEYIQFVPAPTKLGFTAVIADPKLGWSMLADAVKAGQGSTKLFSHPKAPATTVAQFVNDAKQKASMEETSAAIEADLAKVRQDTGLAASDVVRIPQLFSLAKLSSAKPSPGARLAAERLTSMLTPAQAARGTVEELLDSRHTSLHPNVINGTVVSKNGIVTADPFGPVIGGVDILKKAATDAYAKVGMKVAYLDIYSSLQPLDGGVHCTTNTFREMPGQWWKAAS